MADVTRQFSITATLDSSKVQQGLDAIAQGLDQAERKAVKFSIATNESSDGLEKIVTATSRTKKTLAELDILLTRVNSTLVTALTPVGEDTLSIPFKNAKIQVESLASATRKAANEEIEARRKVAKEVIEANRQIAESNKLVAEAKTTVKPASISQQIKLDSGDSAAKFKDIWQNMLTAQRQVFEKEKEMQETRRLAAGTFAEQRVAEDRKANEAIAAARQKLYDKLKVYEERERGGGNINSIRVNLRQSVDAELRAESRALSAAREAKAILTSQENLVKQTALLRQQDVANFKQASSEKIQEAVANFNRELMVAQGSHAAKALADHDYNQKRIAAEREYVREKQALESQIASGQRTAVQAATEMDRITARHIETIRAARDAHAESVVNIRESTRHSRTLLETVTQYGLAWRGVNYLISSAVNAIKSIPAAGIEQQSTISTLHASFSQTPTGETNTKQGEELTAIAMKQIQEEAKRTGIALTTLETNYRTFLASAHMAGESTNTVNSIFKDLDTVITALHMSGDRAQLTFLALSQMFNKGKVQSEELTKQLGNLLPGAFAAFAKATGRTTEQLTADMKAGTVTAHGNIAKFISFYAEQYGDAFSKASQGLNAELGRLSTAWTNFARGVFGGTGDVMTEVVRGFTKLLEVLTVTEAGLESFKEKMGLALGIGAIGAIGAIYKNWNSVAGAIELADKAMQSFIKANPILLLTAGITGGAMMFIDTYNEKKQARLAQEGGLTGSLQSNADVTRETLWEAKKRKTTAEMALAETQDVKRREKLTAIIAEEDVKVVQLTKHYEEYQKQLDELEGVNAKAMEAESNSLKLRDEAVASLYPEIAAYKKLTEQLEQLRQAQKLIDESNAKAKDKWEKAVLAAPAGESPASPDYKENVLTPDLDKALTEQANDKLTEKAAKDLERQKKEANARQKALLDENLQNIRDNAAKQVLVNESLNSELQTKYDSGLISLDEFVKQNKMLLEERTKVQLEANRQTQEALKLELASTVDNVQSTTKISLEMDDSKLSASVKRYKTFIEEASKETGVSSGLIAAIMQTESNGNPNARSSANAMGLMQTLPATYAANGGVSGKIFDPEENIKAGARYLAKLSEYFQNLGLKGQKLLEYTIAAYNAGAGNKGTSRIDRALYGNDKGFQETRNYVPKVLGYLGGEDNEGKLSSKLEVQKKLNKAKEEEAEITAKLSKEASKQHSENIKMYQEDLKNLKDKSKDLTLPSGFGNETAQSVEEFSAQILEERDKAGTEFIKSWQEDMKLAAESMVAEYNRIQDEIPKLSNQVALDKANGVLDSAGYEKAKQTIQRMTETLPVLRQGVEDLENSFKSSGKVAEDWAKGRERVIKEVLGSAEKQLSREITKASMSEGQMLTDEKRNQLRERGVLIGKEEEAQIQHLVELQKQLLAVQQEQAVISSLKNGFIQGFKDILSGTADFGSSFKKIFDDTVNVILNNSLKNLVDGIQSAFSSLAKGGSVSWGNIGMSLIEVGASALVSWLGKSSPKSTPSAAMQTTNKEVYGQAQMAIADSSGRDVNVIASLPSIQRFNSALSIAADAIKANAGKIWDFSSAYLSKISSSLFGETVTKFASSVGDKISSVYNTVVGWGEKLIGGVKELVSSAASSIGITTGANAVNSSVGNVAGNAAAEGVSKTPYVGTALAILKLGYDLFTLAGNKFMTTTDKVVAGLSSVGDAAFSVGIAFTSTGVGLPAAAIAFAVAAGLKIVSTVTDVISNGFNLENSLTLGMAAIGTAILPGIGTIIGAMLGAILGSFLAKPPSATVLSYQTPDANARKVTDEQGDYHVSSGGKSGTVGVTTAFGEVDMRLNNISKNSGLMIDEATKAFLPLLRTIQAFDNALATSIREVDKTFSQDSFKGFKLQAEHEQKLSKLDTSKFVTDRLGDISKSLGATGTVVGKTIETWWGAFSSKLLKADSKENSSYNTTTAFNIEAFIAAELPKLTQLPLKLATLFVQSVKSVADGASQKEFEGQMNDFFAGWEYAKNGLKQIGMDINDTALPDYLTSLVNIGMTVRDSAGALVSFAATFDSAAGDVTKQFNEAFSKIFTNAKEQGYGKEQTSGYVGSYITLANVSKDTGLKATSEELNSLANSLNNAASKAIVTANGVIDQAIATAKLGGVSREAAIQQLSLTGALTAEQIAAGSFSKALVEQQKAMLGGIEFANQTAILTGQTLADVGLSFTDVANIGANLTSTFKDMAEAMNFIDSVAKAVYSPEVYAGKKKDQAAASFSSSAASLGFGKDYTTGQFASFFDTKGINGYTAQLEQAWAKGDKARANALVALGASYATLTEATQTYVTAQSSAATTTSDTASKADTLAGILDGVNKQLYDLSHTELEIKIHDIRLEMEDLAKSASDAGGSIANLSELSKAKLDRLAKDWLKPVEDGLKVVGKSELQNSISDIQEKFTNLGVDAKTLAVENLVSLEDTLTRLNTLKLSELKNVFKPLEEELASLGGTKHSDGIRSISKWYNETIDVSSSLAEAYGVTGETAISWINRIKDARITALNEEHDKIMADNQAQQTEFMSTKFKQDNPDGANLGSSLLSLRSNLLSGITSLIQAGGDYADITKLISTAVTSGTDLILSAQASIASRYKGIFNSIQSTLDTGTKLFFQTKLRVSPDGSTNQKDIDKMIFEYDKATALKQIHEEDFATQMTGLNALLSLQQTKFNSERESLLATIDFAKSLKEHVKDLRVNNSLSTLSNEGRLKEAQKQAYETFAAASSSVDSKERQDARGKLTSKADTYLSEAKAFYASSPEYAKIFDEVTKALDNFGTETVDPQQQLVLLNQSMLEELTQSRIFLEEIKGRQEGKQAGELQNINSIVKYITDSFGVSFSEMLRKYDIEVPEVPDTSSIYQPIIEEIAKTLGDNGFSADQVTEVRVSLGKFALSIEDMFAAGINPEYTRKVGELAKELYIGVGDLINLNLLNKDQGVRVFNLGLDFYTSLNKTLADAKISPEVYNSILDNEKGFTSSILGFLKAGYISGQSFTDIQTSRDIFNTNLLEALRKGTISPTEAGNAYTARNTVTENLFSFLSTAKLSPEDINTILQGFSVLSTDAGYMLAGLKLSPEQVAFISKGYGDSAKGVGMSVGSIGLSEEDKKFYTIGTQLFSQNIGTSVGGITPPTTALTTVKTGIEGMATNVKDGLTSVEFLKPAGDLVIAGINALAGNIAYGLSHALDSIDPSPITNAINGLVASVASMIATQQAAIQPSLIKPTSSTPGFDAVLRGDMQTATAIARQSGLFTEAEIQEYLKVDRGSQISLLSSLPKFANGGITNGLSLAGEVREAIIPIPSGSVRATITEPRQASLTKEELAQEVSKIITELKQGRETNVEGQDMGLEEVKALRAEVKSLNRQIEKILSGVVA